MQDDHAPAPLSIRPVAVADAEAMQRFVASLSPSTLRSRFHGPVRCVGALLRLLVEVDGTSHVALVACVGREIVGEARYVLASDREAEFALAVADSYQGTGLADDLTTRLTSVARACGLVGLFAKVLNGSVRTAAFLRRHGFERMRAGEEPGVTCWAVSFVHSDDN